MLEDSIYALAQGLSKELHKQERVLTATTKGRSKVVQKQV